MISAERVMGFQRILFMVVLVCVACGEMRAQDVSTVPVRGFLPGYDQLSGSIDNIDIASGKLNLTIPLGSLPRGKGGIGYTLNLQYESRLYDLQHDILRIEQSGPPPPPPFLSASPDPPAPRRACQACPASPAAFSCAG